MLVPFSVIPTIGLISEHTTLSAYAVKTYTDVCYLIKIKFILSIHNTIGKALVKMRFEDHKSKNSIGCLKYKTQRI